MKRSDIPYPDLCNIIANRVIGATPNSVHRYLRGLYKTILRQLELNGRIYFKDFGYFELKKREGKEVEIVDPPTGKKHIVYIEPKYNIIFKPSTMFDNSVNENDFKLLTTKQNAKITRQIKDRRKRIKNSSDLLTKAERRRKEE